MSYLILAVAVLIIFFISLITSYTNVSKADMDVTLTDENHLPVSNAKIILWEYDYEPIEHITGNDGKVYFKERPYMFMKTFLNSWKVYPDKVPVRLCFPEFSPYYYRFEGSPFQRRPPYNVFKSQYDFFYEEEWIGKFYEGSLVDSPMTDSGTLKKVMLLKPKLKLERSGKKSFRINLDLQVTHTESE